MSCAICSKSAGIFGGKIAFTCPVCKSDICRECAEKYSNPKAHGGFFGDRHAEITCPQCHTVVKIR